MVEDKGQEFNIGPDNPNDPFQAAISRGKVWGAGASGKYRRTPVTIIGFCIFGLVFIAVGMTISSFFLNAFNINLPVWAVISQILVFLILGFGPMFLGALMIFKVLKK